ncbi:MAG TPA: DUF2905 domain-containing protein [Ignavibacteria bacterium]|nr:DUF2905 domain-containing protein [Ignavibacteria bacterium]
MQSLGKYLIIFGAVIIIVGVILTFFPKINFFGHMPGDIIIKRENFSFYFPIVTSILLSIVLTLIFWLINFFSKK